jgi:hypothetical protein
MSEFFGWYMVRKVIAGNTCSQAAGTMNRTLDRWPETHGYIATTAQPEARAGPGACAARPARRTVGAADVGRGVERYEDPFMLVTVSDRGWRIVGTLEDVEGVVALPPDIVRLGRVGWKVSGVVAGSGRGLRWLDIRNVNA